MRLYESKKIVSLKEANFDTTGYMTSAEADAIVDMLDKALKKIPNINNHYIKVSRTQLKDGDKYLEHYGGNDVYVEFAKEKNPDNWPYRSMANDVACTMFKIFFDRRTGKAEVNTWQTPSFNNHKKAGVGAFNKMQGTPEQVVASVVKYLTAVMKNIDKFPNEK